MPSLGSTPWGQAEFQFELELRLTPKAPEWSPREGSVSILGTVEGM